MTSTLQHARGRLAATIAFVIGTALIIGAPATAGVGGDYSEPKPTPNTKLSAKPAKKTTAKTATFKFRSTVTGSRYECSLDRAKWSMCWSPKTYRGLKPGKHNFRVRARVAAKFDRSPAVFTWKVVKK